MRTIRPLPPELTKILFDLGPRTLVLVEGDDDREVFREWYRDHLGDIEFYAAVGHLNVAEFLQDILSQSSHKRAYGIIDKDFRDEQEVQTALADPQNHLFILRRYALENYLLEPLAVWEELRVYHGSAFTVPNPAAMEQALLDLCRKLLTVMAANWVFHEAGVKHFSEGHDASDRNRLIEQAAQRLACSVAEAEQRVSEKEAIIEQAIATLNGAHMRINGKHLLHHLYQVHVVPYKRGLVREHLRNLLARTVKDKIGLHADIKAIVEGRILLK